MNEAQGQAHDKISRSFARLNSIRKNLPDTYAIDEPIVNEYAAAWSRLEELGFDVEEFKIPQDGMYGLTTNRNHMTGHTTRAKSRLIKRSHFVTKLDAVLEYFTIADSEEPIGFRGGE